MLVLAIAVALLPISVGSMLVAAVIEGFTVTPLFTLPIVILSFPRPMSFWREKWFPKLKSKDKSSEVIRMTRDIESVDWKIYSEIGPLVARCMAKKAYQIKLSEYNLILIKIYLL
jgi:hypothetical protein